MRCSGVQIQGFPSDVAFTGVGIEKKKNYGGGDGETGKRGDMVKERVKIADQAIVRKARKGNVRPGLPQGQRHAT